MPDPLQQPSARDPARTLAALRHGDAQFKSLLESLPAGAYTCDAEGLITSFNQLAVELWGRAPRLNDPLDRYCGSFQLYDPDGTPIAHDQCWMAQALKNERGYVGKEIVVERPDGERRALLAYATPIHDESGKLLGAVNLILDANDRGLAPGRAQPATDPLSELVESSPVPIVVIDFEPAIVRLWNPAAEQLFGWRHQEVTGKVLPVLSEEALADCRARLKAAPNDRPGWSLVTAESRKNGPQIEVKMSSGALHDAAGNVNGIVLVFAEVAERGGGDSAMNEADRARNEFLATLAHELRNPLSPIRNAVQILHRQRSPTPELEWALGIIDRQLGQMTRLIDDLLDIARIAGSRLTLRKERIDLAEVMDLAVETSRPLLESCGHEFVLTQPPQKLQVNGDRTRLAQVISNLLNNAAKYTGRGGRIWLTVARQGGEAVITVRDTGIGISAEMLPHIFEMFAQMERPAGELKSGLGIGLTLVKRLVEMHGGAITAHSDGPGKGSEFVVRLPILAAEPPLHDLRRLAKEDTADARSLRILVVDDNEDSAASLSLLLQLEGHQTRTAHDGLDAIQVAESFHPQAILLDIGLPKLNGYAVASIIRRQAWGKKVVMIATTGWGLDSDRKRSREAGFDHHLVKPVDPTTVAKILSTVDPAVVDNAERSWTTN